MTSPKRPPGTSIGPADLNEVVVDAFGRRISSMGNKPADNRRRYYSDVDYRAQGTTPPGRSRVPAGGRGYDPDRNLYAQDKLSLSPVAQAIEDARRRRVVQSANSTERQNYLSVERAKSDAARYTESGKRISDVPGRQRNIFDEQYTQGMKDAAENVFDVLNMDAITSDHTYTVGVERTEKANPWEGKDSGHLAEQRARAGIKPIAATESAVVNTIKGGLADFQRMSVQNPDMYNTMVYRLWNAGLISGDLENAGLGGWTVKAGKALANAMAAVSQLNSQHIPMTLDEYVDSLTKGREQAIAEGGGGGGGGGAGPAPRQYTGRDELNARLKSTAQEVLGRSLSDEEADKFASAFHGTEDAAYNAAEAGKAYDNPSAPASAQSFVEDGHETEAAAFRVQGFMERLKTELGL